MSQNSRLREGVVYPPFSNNFEAFLSVEISDMHIYSSNIPVPKGIQIELRTFAKTGR